MGIPRPQWATTQRRSRRLDRRRHHHLHAAPLRCSLHITGFSGRRAQRRRIRPDLPSAVALHTTPVPQTAVEPRPLEQAVPVHRGFLERMGGGCALLAVPVSCVWGESQLYLFLNFPFRLYTLCANLIGLDSPIIMASVTIFALISYVIMPEEAWLPRNRISHFVDSKGASTTVEEVGVPPREAQAREPSDERSRTEAPAQ